LSVYFWHSFHNFFLSSFYSCIGGTLWHLWKVFQYIIVEFTPSIIHLHLPDHSQNIFTCFIFPVSYMITIIFLPSQIHPLTPFSYILILPPGIPSKLLCLCLYHTILISHITLWWGRAVWWPIIDAVSILLLITCICNHNKISY
jgi:hypothetical protein